MTDPEYLDYQRVLIPMLDWYRGWGPSPQPPSRPTHLYGIVRIIDGEPERTYCCSTTASVWVQAIGWEVGCPDGQVDRLDNDNWEAPEDGYYSVRDVKAGLTGAVFDAEDDDDAREEAQGNW